MCLMVKRKKKRFRYKGDFMDKKIVAVIANDPAWVYNLRGEVLQALLLEGYRVVIIDGYAKKAEDLKKMGCEFIDVPMNRHGMNPISEFKLVMTYKRVLKKLKPDVVLTYTIKPNVYGGLACQWTRTPYICNITGLGTAIENGGVLQKVLITLYKLGLKKAQKVFFQNESQGQHWHFRLQ